MNYKLLISLAVTGLEGKVCLLVPAKSLVCDQKVFITIAFLSIKEE